MNPGIGKLSYPHYSITPFWRHCSKKWQIRPKYWDRSQTIHDTIINTDFLVDKMSKSAKLPRQSLQREDYGIIFDWWLLNWTLDSSMDSFMMSIASWTYEKLSITLSAVSMTIVVKNQNKSIQCSLTAMCFTTFASIEWSSSFSIRRDFGFGRSTSYST